MPASCRFCQLKSSESYVVRGNERLRKVEISHTGRLKEQIRALASDSSLDLGCSLRRVVVIWRGVRSW